MAREVRHPGLVQGVGEDRRVGFLAPDLGGERDHGEQVQRMPSRSMASNTFSRLSATRPSL